MKSKFVTMKMALKGGKTKADYIQACREKGLLARYSGKVIVEPGLVKDEVTEVQRAKGFYLTPLSAGRDASAMSHS